MNRRTLITGAAAFALATPALAASGEWRTDAWEGDVDRLDRLDQAWREALKEASDDGHGPTLRALGVLRDRTVSLPRPQPAPGTYRCRVIKLGSQGESGLSFVAYPFFRCRVDLTPGGDLTFRKTTGSQRTSGNFYPDTARRLVYLGAQDWGSEGPKRYGDDHDRDQIGVLERIGPNRYRLALPFPRQESVLDLIEIVK